MGGPSRIEELPQNYAELQPEVEYHVMLTQDERAWLLSILSQQGGQPATGILKKL